MNIKKATVTVDAPTAVPEARTPVPTMPTRPSWLGVATVVALVAFAYMAFVYAPEDSVQGPTQRIFYIHVPSAWIAFVGFAIVFAGSIGYLVTRGDRWDTIAAASAEIGFLFTTVVLVTGMMWAKEIWGVYWTWDPRLTSFLLLWLLYVAYLVVRAYVPDPAKKARFSAVIGIVAFLDVPIVFLSVKLWRTIHPTPVVITENGPAMPTSMLLALMTGLLAFSLFFAYLLRLRLSVRAMQNALEEDEL